jgi:large subunit ribosomal protein L10
MLTRQKKEELVKKLASQVKTGKVMIFSDFTGTTVAKMKNLRDELRKTGSTYKITKKKLIERSFREAGIEIDSNKMEGQLGVAIGQEDEVSAAKVLAKFAKENSNFKILEGVLEKKLISVEEVMALSKLPSKEELLAKFVGTINAPVSGFVNVLAGNIRGLLTVLKGIADSKS